VGTREISTGGPAWAQDLLGNVEGAAVRRCVIVSISDTFREFGLSIEHNDNSPPPPAERRPRPRKRVLLGGIITFADGAHSFDCTFRNLSESGARIVVAKNAQFPSEFYLINIRDRVVYEARVTWNSGGEIGVNFKNVHPLSDITDPSLGYLKRLWLTKAVS
jgi:PilZ domain